MTVTRHKASAPVLQSATRRNFLGMTVGAVAATAVATAPALATAPPDIANVRPELRAAIDACETAREALMAAKAEVDHADRQLTEWERQQGPRPTSKRGAKRWDRKVNDQRFEVMTPPWDRQMAAENAFRAAQMALAKVNPATDSELVAKAYCAVVFDAVRMAGPENAVIGFSVALAIATRHATGRLPGQVLA